MTIDQILRKNLTDEQYRVATAEDRRILCLACAGSGKSRTMAYRIARQIALGIRPESIVAFTFTEKAAATIRRRVAEALKNAGIDPLVIGKMYIGTIHGFCQRLLGEIDPDYRQFDVLDDNRLYLYLLSRWNDLNLQRMKERYGSKPLELIRELADAWKIYNQELLDIDTIQEADPFLAKFLLMLNRRLHQERYIDFSLMVREAVDRIRSSEAPDEILDRYVHIFVDEYQDVNRAQATLISLLHYRHPEHGTLFAVGDDDQSIYQWRGADVSYIQDFRENFPDAAVFTLSVNFRSTPTIVRLADRFVQGELDPIRFSKNPRAAHNRIPQEVGIFWFETREEEAEWVARRIAELLGTCYEESNGSRGLTPADFAILMRSTRVKEASGEPRHKAFTKALERYGIPYSLEAGGSPFERKEVQVLREAFELLGLKNLKRERVKRFFLAKVLPVYPFADWESFVHTILRWWRQIHAPRRRGLPRVRIYPQEMLHEILDAFNLKRSNFPEPVMRDIALFSRMMLDVETVYVSIDTTKRYDEIRLFLKELAEHGYDISTDDLVRPDAVTVATVHKVKGLEFPCVFVVDVEAQRFPRRNSHYRGLIPAHLLSKALERGRYITTDDGEARLFYTALTRAERLLYVTGAEHLPSAKRKRRKSRFFGRLEEIAYGGDEDWGFLTRNPEKVTSWSKCDPRRRIEEVDFPTSFSEIRYYLRCPKDYQFRHRFGFNPPVPEIFGYGQTIHAAVERLHTHHPDYPPEPEEVRELVERTFHLKHVPQSTTGQPGPYEKAREAAVRLIEQYVRSYQEDFRRTRTVEVSFEIPVGETGAVIHGSIDLVLWEDEEGHIERAEIIDFKTMESPQDPWDEKVEWTELSLQVQLYALAAEQVLDKNAKTGHVHFLKDNRRVEVPIHGEALENALSIMEWAVRGIIDGDFPMRPHPEKCARCDFWRLCLQHPQDFQSNRNPPPKVWTPEGRLEIAAFRLFDGGHDFREGESL